MSPTARPRAAVSLSKITAEEKTVEVRLKLAGTLAIAFDDDRRACQAEHGEPVDPAVLAVHRLGAEVETDKAFARRRDNPGVDSPGARS